jgi:hypothetical protein
MAKTDEGRIYIAQKIDPVTGGNVGAPRLIHAMNPAQARRHASRDEWVINVGGALDIARIMGEDGVKVESARTED